MALWAAAFGVMLSLRGIGDRFPGQELPYWFTACQKHPEKACPMLAFNVDTACHRDSGWACNYLAIMEHHGLRLPAEMGADFDPTAAHPLPDPAPSIASAVSKAC